MGDYLYKILKLSKLEFTKLTNNQPIIHELFKPFPMGWVEPYTPYYLAHWKKGIDTTPSGQFHLVLVKLPKETLKSKKITLTLQDVVYSKQNSTTIPGEVVDRSIDVNQYDWYSHPFDYSDGLNGEDSAVQVDAFSMFGLSKDKSKLTLILCKYEGTRLRLNPIQVSEQEFADAPKLGEKLPRTMDLDDMFIYHVLMRWAMAANTDASGPLDYMKVKPRFKGNAAVLYRGLHLSSSERRKLANGLPIFLENQAYASWTEDPHIAGQFGSLIIKKTVKKANVVISPYHFAKFYGIDESGLGLLPYSGERETIIKNTPYWLRVSPSEVINLNKPSLTKTQSTKPGFLNSLKKFFSVVAFANEPDADLAARYLKAKQAYYNSGNPIMSDQEFDKLEDEIRRRDPNNPVLKQIGSPTKEKVKLPFHMGSLDKIKPGTTAVGNWLKKTAGPYILMDKLDGISFYLKTRNGQPVMATTRGDGEYGQDISFLIPHLRLPMHSLPDLDLRGELVINRAKFEHYKQEFANSRNMVSGIANSKSVHKAVKDVDVVIYEQLAPRGIPSQDFDKLRRLGFHVVTYTVADTLDEQTLINYLTERKKASDHEIDGIVIAQNKPNPITLQGNPKHAVAFKQDLSEAQLPRATVIKVHWKLSDKGLIKPRVEITPVNLGGVTIRFTTGYNARWIKQNNVGPGTEVLVKRAGEVIPVIAKILKSTEAQYPTDMSYVWDERGVDIVPKSTVTAALMKFFNKASDTPPYQEEDGSSFTHAGHTYDLNKLLKLTHSQKPQEFKVNDLIWVIEHNIPTIQRVKTADIRIPILVYNDPTHGQTTLDGVHRLTKAFMQGIPMLPGKLVTNQQLSQCLIK